MVPEPETNRAQDIIMRRACSVCGFVIQFGMRVTIIIAEEPDLRDHIQIKNTIQLPNLVGPAQPRLAELASCSGS